MSKKILFFALVCIMVFALIGCTSTPTPSSSEEPPTVESTPTPAPEPTPELTPEPTPEPTPIPVPTPSGSIGPDGAYQSNDGDFTFTAPTDWVYTNTSTAQGEAAQLSLLDENNDVLAIARISYSKLPMAIAEDMLEDVYAMCLLAVAGDYEIQGTSTATVLEEECAVYEFYGTDETIGMSMHYTNIFFTQDTALFIFTYAVPESGSLSDYQDAFDAITASFQILK